MFIYSFFLAFALSSCVDIKELDKQISDLNTRIEVLEQSAQRINQETIGLRELFEDACVVVGYDYDPDKGYSLSLSDGTVLNVYFGDKAQTIVPILGIAKDGSWVVSLDGGLTFSPIKGSENSRRPDGKTPQIRVDSMGFWEISLDDGKTWEKILDSNDKPMDSAGKGESSFFKSVELSEDKSRVEIEFIDGQKINLPLVSDFDIQLVDKSAKLQLYQGQTIELPVIIQGVEKAFFQLPQAWKAQLTDEMLTVTAPSDAPAGKYEVVIIAQSDKNYLKKLSLVFTLEKFDNNFCKPWNDFLAQNSDNVLLDYSYAGYNHGESAPLEASALGYKVYNVCDYGAVPNDGKSDREAFLKCVAAAIGTPTGQLGYEISKNSNIIFNPKEKANAIVYFPEGEFILHTSQDDTPGVAGGLPISHCIQIRSGNFVLRGAGRDKTTIIMQDQNYASNPDVLYSSPLMLDFKHNSWISHYPTKALVKGTAAKGTYSVELSSTAGMAVGDWVCINVKNNDPAFVAEELAPYKVTDRMTDIKDDGVKVNDFHQIKSISGNVVTFYEPIMRAIDPKYGWEVMKWPHYENVGVEDLTFVGNAKVDFDHHASWQDDGAFKPLGLTRLANSWIRRVRFTSVSEACTIAMCANVSAYDIEIDGNRGHSSVRSAGSSRVFIGAVYDHSAGKRFIKEGQLGEYMASAGQYHAVGVSKPSMGTVLWKNVWGDDSCFEAHASQPRATLIDCCKGGWMRWRQGGHDSQVPNHLNDLVLWNFTSTTPYSEQFVWWDSNSLWWKFVMPTVVGFHGETCNFDESQMRLSFSNGIEVNPGSLYEAQLEKRLGSVPAWLIQLKNN